MKIPPFLAIAFYADQMRRSHLHQVLRPHARRHPAGRRLVFAERAASYLMPAVAWPLWAWIGYRSFPETALWILAGLALWLGFHSGKPLSHSQSTGNTSPRRTT